MFMLIFMLISMRTLKQGSCAMDLVIRYELMLCNATPHITSKVQELLYDTEFQMFVHESRFHWDREKCVMLECH